MTSKKLQTTEDPDEWADWLNEAELQDPYYNLNYTTIWADPPESEAVGIRFRAENGTVLYPVIKESLEYLSPDEKLYDVRTAYDFGGPLVLGTCLKETSAQFLDAWQSLMTRWNVVTEFARLHPYRQKEKPPDAEFHADNIHVDVSDGYDKAYDDYHTSQRNHVKNAKKAGVTTSVHRAPDKTQRQKFIDLYYHTMREVGADPSYFFFTGEARPTLQVRFYTTNFCPRQRDHYRSCPVFGDSLGDLLRLRGIRSKQTRQAPE
jgi:hypothetical protein